LKRNIKILIIGTILFSAGLAFTIFASTSFVDKYKSSSVLVQGEVVEPTKAVAARIFVNSTDKLYLTVISQPRINFMTQLQDKDDKTILSLASNGTLVRPIGPLVEGTYTFSFLNLGSRSSIVFAILSTQPVGNDLTSLFPESNLAVVGTVLLMMGIIVLIVVPIIFVIDRKKQNRK